MQRRKGADIASSEADHVCPYSPRVRPFIRALVPLLAAGAVVVADAVGDGAGAVRIRGAGVDRSADARRDIVGPQPVGHPRPRTRSRRAPRCGSRARASTPRSASTWRCASPRARARCPRRAAVASTQPARTRRRPGSPRTPRPTGRRSPSRTGRADGSTCACRSRRSSAPSTAAPCPARSSPAPTTPSRAIGGSTSSVPVAFRP